MASAAAVDPGEQMAQWFETSLGKTLAHLTADSVSRLIPTGYYRTGYQAGYAHVDLLQRAEQSVSEILPYVKKKNCSNSATLCKKLR